MTTHLGSCHCKQWTIEVSVSQSLQEFHPRICDCEYCKANPSAVISAPDMKINLRTDNKEFKVDKNGDQLATFYRCKSCNDLLAVGCVIDGTSRGAVNAVLLHDSKLLGASVQIQPRLLSVAQKLERWAKLWGVLNGV